MEEQKERQKNSRKKNLIMIYEPAPMTDLTLSEIPIRFSAKLLKIRQKKKKLVTFTATQLTVNRVFFCVFFFFFFFFLNLKKGVI